MRRLAIWAAAFAGAIFLAHYVLPPEYLLWAAVMSAVFTCSAFLFRGDTRLRIILIFLGMAVGFAAGAVSYAQKTAPCVELSGETLSFNAEVTELPTVSERYTYVTISIKDDALPRVDARLCFYYTQAPELTPGDEIYVTARVKFSGERFGEEWYGHTSKNIYLLCYPEKVEVTGKSPFAFIYYTQNIRNAIADMSLKVFPESSAPFITAMLTGKVSSLYEDAPLYSAMTATGIYHVVSVSGMHVAFLVGFLRLILRRGKTASLVGIPAVWIFAAIMGGDPTIIRAAFMQSAVLAAPLLKRENDGITSLMAVLAVLLLINPDACASVSLQLSFAAMLGMILITPQVNKMLTAGLLSSRRRSLRANNGKESLYRKAKYNVRFSVISAFSATIGALTFSTPVMAYYFGCVTAYSIIVNILVFWAVSACFMLGFISCFLGMIWMTLGIGCGAIAGAFASYIIAVAKFMGGLPLARIYVTEGYFLFWLISAYAVFIIWYFIRRGRAFRPIIPTALVISGLLMGVILMQTSVEKAPASFTAVDVGQGQSLVLTSGNSAAVIDCGGGAKTANAGDITAEYLLSRGITSIDVLFTTHFHEDHVNGIIRLMTYVNVKNLVVAPEGGVDTRRDEVIDFAAKQGIPIHVITENTEILMGDMRILAYKPVSRVSPELIFLASVNEYDILITGDAYIEEEHRLLLTQELPDIEIFVAGHHGSKYSSGEAFLEAIQAETVIISCGYNSYGHPAPEVLERFADAEMEVLRTDELGHVRIELSAP